MGCTADDLILFLKSRRSIRKYKDDKVPFETIRKIIDTARYAPSAHNSQPWKFVFIDNPEVKNRLSELHGGAVPLRKAPHAIVTIVDIEKDPKSYLIDGANATIYLMLAAHALGLGTVWIQTIGYEDDIRRILNLSRRYVPVSILAIGYPGEKPEPRPRRDLSDVLEIMK